MAGLRAIPGLYGENLSQKRESGGKEGRREGVGLVGQAQSKFLNLSQKEMYGTGLLSSFMSPGN